jgi:hypothetical protein
MKTKATFWKTLIICIAVVGVLSSCMSMPSERVSSSRHPNLAQAQTLIQNAIDKLSAAQMANEYDMGGHAAKAIQLLNQAYAEIKLAAEAANKR